jgi:hypothetical protein
MGEPAIAGLASSVRDLPHGASLQHPRDAAAAGRTLLAAVALTALIHHPRRGRMLLAIAPFGALFLHHSDLPAAVVSSTVPHALAALCVAVAAAFAMPGVALAQAAAAAPSAAAAAHPSRAYWVDARGTPAASSARGARPALQLQRLRASTLDVRGLTALAATAPLERSAAARQSPLVISLPDPRGGYQRFAITESPVMEPKLAAQHPEIKTYAGRGIDDPTASIRISTSPLGFQAAVRSTQGSWYIDPYYHLDDSLYASYYRRDLVNPRGALTETVMTEPQASVSRGLFHAADKVTVRAVGFTPNGQVTVTVRNTGMDVLPRQTLFATADAEGVVNLSLVADPYRNLGSYSVTLADGRNMTGTSYQVVGDRTPVDASVGTQLRTFRLALVTDPTYTNYFGGPAFVTAAKAALVNRITQVYESETSIRLVLVGDNDKLNFNTTAAMTGANGPCGGTACYTATQVASCGGGTLTQNRVVIGQIIGARNYDVGHIALGVNGGGVAELGVVGQANKARGCTGIPTPTGDAFAVDYVAHELGHQFAGNHTFNGTISNCSGTNRSAGASVEPGSGSSIMAYAGICGNDNLQPHSDPYWSWKSFDELVALTSGAETNLSEVQRAALIGFTANGQEFKLRYNGVSSTPIVRGTNFTTAGVKAAVEAITGWPSGGTVTVSTLGDTSFLMTFGGTLAGVNVPELELVDCSGGCSGYINDLTAGGPTTRQGTVTALANSAPVVTVAPSYTIPLRTPFALTGSATDADGDPITYMWEQTDRGAAAGTSLVSNTKANGPLFRQFGTRAVVSGPDSLLYNSPGENLVTTNPLRVFPDMLQVLANNTNAETGLCPAIGATPTADQIDCYSEFLPTADYVGFAGVNASPLALNFKLTARDGRGGVNSATTQLLLATGAGPFLVSSPNTAVQWMGGVSRTVSWSVANTNVAPVGTANVKITLSVDGGASFPYTLAASTPNSGSATVEFPNLPTSTARLKIEAVGNVFFDVSNTDFTLKRFGDVNGDTVVDCSDLATVKASVGKVPGDPGYDARADVNGDGVIDAQDVNLILKSLANFSRCRG